MATNPKLEFYRFELNHKDLSFPTFRDFATEVLNSPQKTTDEKVIEACFKHFIKSLTGEYAKNDRKKKKIGLEKKKSINKYLDKGPSFNSDSHTISGVINGGPYGRERIISNNDDEEDSTTLGINKTVLMYFFFFAYLPPDHNEGFFMIHSNSKDESIASIFKSFMVNIFKGKKFKKPIESDFCPKSFQDEFKNGSRLKSMSFKTSFVEDTHSSNPILNLFNEYDIKIEATPKNKQILGSSAIHFFEKLLHKTFGAKTQEIPLSHFTERKVILENDITNSQKTFEWNTKDNDFVPVVYLQGRIRKENADGTPDFDELKQYCTTIFNDEILPELRPDLNVTKT